MVVFHKLYLVPSWILCLKYVFDTYDEAFNENFNACAAFSR